MPAKRMPRPLSGAHNRPIRAHEPPHSFAMQGRTLPPNSSPPVRRPRPVSAPQHRTRPQLTDTLVTGHRVSELMVDPAHASVAPPAASLLRRPQSACNIRGRASPSGIGAGVVAPGVSETKEEVVGRVIGLLRTRMKGHVAVSPHLPALAGHFLSLSPCQVETPPATTAQVSPGARI